MGEGERRASFIGIGAQKTASTWLHALLAQLPGVATSEPKELDFFSHHFDRGYGWYERHFAAGPSRHRGEVSPSYFIDSDAPVRAARYNAGLAILVTLRDPVERAFSNHLHEVRAGHASGANRDFATALAGNNPLYLEQGFYARHLSRWLDHFPRENLLVLFQERIRQDEDGAAAHLAARLGVALPQTLVRRRPNESIDYRNRTLGTALWRAGEWARRSGLGGPVERVKRMPVVRTLRAANQTVLRDVVAPMTADTEARLTEAYAPDVEALAGLLGEAPPWPRFAAVATRPAARARDAQLFQ